ncbi:hypothetical protein BGZ61DRAFT_445814 [Ilyonectria robusta]|uniref:uncharacterized protein n=1 Tax=Ilyonectria robusta TaxID=1079257 RepID=UPI001E8D6882|nr:uncharacterized protein BGZ61DRAFT_445814 [Ilyonectria robusta]KAH8734103.1 hypothetical protein BGZ61DRAFT_445814 [Ilyonectria robusta]
MSDSTTINVLGAGVIGLTCALVLSNDPKNKVMVVAEFMPGDYDIGYASCWAGANFFPMGKAGSLQAELEAKTWPVLKNLAQNVPEACIHFQDAVLYKRETDTGNNDHLFMDPGQMPWWNNIVENYRSVPSKSLPPGIAAGSQFTTVCINTALYLPYLLGQCRRRGVIFKRQKLDSLADATKIPHADGRLGKVLVNATGLGSRWLKGVEDQTMIPARGQIMLVRNDPGVMMGVSQGENGDELGYCMTRAAGGGTILGGCYQLNNYDSNPDMNLALRFMKTCVSFCPALVAAGEGIEGLKPIRHGVGLRPVREGGVRIETETLNDDVETAVVHCYGHGGWGYQTSWASADAVAQLVRGLKLASQARL